MDTYCRADKLLLFVNNKLPRGENTSDTAPLYGEEPFNKSPLLNPTLYRMRTGCIMSSLNYTLETSLTPPLIGRREGGMELK